MDGAPGEFVNSNAADLGTFMSTGLSLVVEDRARFDTLRNCTASSILGSCRNVFAGGSTAMCVCRNDELTVRGLLVTGTAGLAILSYTSVTVMGALEMEPGTGAGPVAANLGAGGGFGTPGGRSGAIPSDAASGNPELVPLRGGTASAGLGGGALQISARISVQVTGTISASGGGAPEADKGGGSGGAILLEARAVTVSGAVVANGGSGSSELHPGSDGHPSATQAAPGGEGGVIPDCTPAGGDGSIGNGPGMSGFASCGRSGGGGGGAGRVRINAHTSCDCSGMFSPTPTFGTL
jgi:hypothetical protein